jgi:regulator of RNase E activity RraA
VIEEWKLQIETPERRQAPAGLRQRFKDPDVVSTLSDRLRERGLLTSVDFPAGSVPTKSVAVHDGPVLTASYMPRRVLDKDNRLGYDKLAKLSQPGDVLVIDANRCHGSGMGGNIGLSLKRAELAACIIDGRGRDYDEISEHGLALVASHWGIARARDTTELSHVGGTICFMGITVHPDDYVVMNRWGAVFIPQSVTWDDIEAMLK